MPAKEMARTGAASLHPAGLVVIWLGYALCIPWLRLADLAVIATLSAIPLLLGRFPEFLKLLRRTRWLLLSLILIYAFATPGTSLIPAWDFSPSREGLLSGGAQALRLLAMLAGLAVLLAAASGQHVLAGLYQLLRPFSRLGINIDRAAARVWLTLHYTEHMGPGRPAEWRERFHDSLGEDDGAGQAVSFEIRPFSRMDYLLLVLAALLLGLLLARGGG